MHLYRQSSAYIDWQHPSILEKSAELAQGVHEPRQVVKQCFEFVRDQIQHSGDAHMNPVTCRASYVLQYGTGYCYAKSHLLAALLRANGFYAGLCYQRLTIENDQPPFCLHGLNAIFLDKMGWYRMDARGNRGQINAQFRPPYEHLAFSIVSKGEMDFPEVWPEALADVIRVLERSQTYQDVLNHLPDMEVR